MTPPKRTPTLALGGTLSHLVTGATALILATLWLTWPAPAGPSAGAGGAAAVTESAGVSTDILAALGAVGFLGAGALGIVGQRRFALVVLGIAVPTSVGLPATLLAWRPWVAAGLLALLLGELLVDPARPRSLSPRAWWTTGGGVVLALLAGLGLYAWRPTRYSLVGDEGPMAATLAIGAIAAALVLWLTAEDGEADETATPAGTTGDDG